MALGLNPYDVRRTCDRQKDGQLCLQANEVDRYLPQQTRSQEGAWAVSTKTFESPECLLNFGVAIDFNAVCV